MDSYEVNKIAGAILGTVLLILGMQSLAGIVYSGNKPDKLAYSIEVEEPADDHGAATDEPVEVVSMATMMGEADADKGLVAMKKCGACHTWDKGGAKKIGPNLYGILGRQIASVAGFAYSPAMTAKAQEVGAWSYETLSDFLKAPKKYIKGTKMAFIGLKKDNQRANVILYLRGQADSPMALPAE